MECPLVSAFRLVCPSVLAFQSGHLSVLAFRLVCPSVLACRSDHRLVSVFLSAYP